MPFLAGETIRKVRHHTAGCKAGQTLNQILRHPQFENTSAPLFCVAFGANLHCEQQGRKLFYRERIQKALAIAISLCMIE